MYTYIKKQQTKNTNHKISDNNNNNNIKITKMNRC